MIIFVMDSIRTIIRLLSDLVTFCWLFLRPPGALDAENLFLRKQLAMYEERRQKNHRTNTSFRVDLVLLSRLFDWRDALVVVKPQTLVRWHRQGFRPFWLWKLRPGRPPIPQEPRALIRELALNNPTWGEERIAYEFLLKLGICVSPRTIRMYMPNKLSSGPRGDQRLSTFVHNHAAAILACDFSVVVTAAFRLHYVFVVIDHQTRWIVHCNVAAHPTAAWTLQQLRDAIALDHICRFLLHDRDAIYSHALDQPIKHMGLRVLRSPPRSPQASTICERVVGTVCRKCLDFLIPQTEHHLRRVLKYWFIHYNEGRPHSSLGPGIQDPPIDLPIAPHKHHHLIPDKLKVAHPIIGGLHHEYGLIPGVF